MYRVLSFPIYLIFACLTLKYLYLTLIPCPEQGEIFEICCTNTQRSVHSNNWSSVIFITRSGEYFAVCCSDYDVVSISYEYSMWRHRRHLWGVIPPANLSGGGIPPLLI